MTQRTDFALPRAQLAVALVECAHRLHVLVELLHHGVLVRHKTLRAALVPQHRRRRIFFLLKQRARGARGSSRGVPTGVVLLLLLLLLALALFVHAPHRRERHQVVFGVRLLLLAAGLDSEPAVGRGGVDLAREKLHERVLHRRKGRRRHLHLGAVAACACDMHMHMHRRGRMHACMRMQEGQAGMQAGQAGR